MWVVSVLSQKGGSGKSTVVQCLAVAAAADRKRVLILDLDPQPTAANWADRRSAAGKQDVVATPVPQGRVGAAVDAARSQGLDLVLIDSPGKLEGAAIAAAQLADLVVIPVNPQINDLETVPATQRLLLGVGGRRAIAVINDAPVGGDRHTETAAALKKMGLESCPEVMYHRIAFADAPLAGLSPQEYQPRGKASAEAKGVYKFIKQLLK